MYCASHIPSAPFLSLILGAYSEPAPVFIQKKSTALAFVKIVNVRTAYSDALYFDKDFIRMDRQADFQLVRDRFLDDRIPDLVQVLFVSDNHLIQICHECAFVPVLFVHDYTPMKKFFSGSQYGCVI